jgi:anti-sigma regulatory factor (Ser/Thr protein kinase)
MERRNDSTDRSESATPSVGNGDRDSQSFTCKPSSGRSARAFVCSSLARHGATKDLLSDFELVVGELTANAIEHGVGANILVTVDFTDSHWWVVEIAGSSNDVDDNVLDPNSWAIAEPDAKSGRGLGITRALMDDITTTIESHWLTIRCRRSVSAITQA